MLSLRTVFLLTLAAMSAAQSYSSDPRNAAILTDDRFLKTNGQFGSAYKQEDGVEFKEESDADGTRRGSYSYLDPSGQRRTVTYTAGKNGFQATGDHLPAAPAPVVNPLPQYNPPQQPQYNPVQRQYSPVQTQPQAYNTPVNEEDGQWVDDTRQEYPSNNPVQWNNPAPQTWTNPQTYAPVRAQWNSNPNPAPQQQWNVPSSTAAPVTQRWSAPLETTPQPHRFYPPGRLSLNRSPDGFSYSFNKA